MARCSICSWLLFDNQYADSGQYWDADGDVSIDRKTCTFETKIEAWISFGNIQIIWLNIHQSKLAAIFLSTIEFYIYPIQRNSVPFIHAIAHLNIINSPNTLPKEHSDSNFATGNVLYTYSHLFFLQTINSHLTLSLCEICFHPHTKFQLAPRIRQCAKCEGARDMCVCVWCYTKQSHLSIAFGESSPPLNIMSTHIWHIPFAIYTTVYIQVWLVFWFWVRSTIQYMRHTNAELGYCRFLLTMPRRPRIVYIYKYSVHRFVQLIVLRICHITHTHT